MNQDPDEVGRARVSAQTFAEILNSLIDPISFKTMFFCTILLVVTTFITNAAFGIYRAKMTSGPPHGPDLYVPPPISATTIHHHPAWGSWVMPMQSSTPIIGMGSEQATFSMPQTTIKKGTRTFDVGEASKKLGMI